MLDAVEGEDEAEDKPKDDLAVARERGIEILVELGLQDALGKEDVMSQVGGDTADKVMVPGALQGESQDTELVLESLDVKKGQRKRKHKSGVEWARGPKRRKEHGLMYSMGHQMARRSRAQYMSWTRTMTEFIICEYFSSLYPLQS